MSYVKNHLHTEIFVMDIQQVSSECITYNMHDFRLDLKIYFKYSSWTFNIQHSTSECIKYDIHYFGLDF